MARIFWPQLRVALLGAILLLDITQHHKSQASAAKPDFSKLTVEQASYQMADTVCLGIERHFQLREQSEATEDITEKEQLLNDSKTVWHQSYTLEYTLFNLTKKAKKPDEKLSKTYQKQILEIYEKLEEFGVPGELKIIPGTIQELMSIALSRTSLYSGIFTNLSSSWMMSMDKVLVNSAYDKVETLKQIRYELLDKYKRENIKYKKKPDIEDTLLLKNAIDAAKDAVEKMWNKQREQEKCVKIGSAIASALLTVGLTSLIYYGGHYILGSADQPLVNQTKSVTASNLPFEAETAFTAFTAVTKGISPVLVVVIILLGVALLTGGAYYFFQKLRQAGSKTMSTSKSRKSIKLTTQSPNQSNLQTAQVATTSTSSALNEATSKSQSQSPGADIKQKTKSASSALNPVTTADRR